MKKSLKISAAAIAAIGIILGSTGITHAATSYVSGNLSASGALIQYDYTRTHTYTGPISLTVNNMPSGYLRLGLRDMKTLGGPQFTSTIQWNKNGIKAWNGVAKNTRFAFQGRMQSCSWFCDTDWGGHLTY